jgi:tRNA(adenine34) deaminase
VVRDRRLTHRPEVYSGVLEAECAALVRRFFGPCGRDQEGGAVLSIIPAAA